MSNNFITGEKFIINFFFFGKLGIFGNLGIPWEWQYSHGNEWEWEWKFFWEFCNIPKNLGILGMGMKFVGMGIPTVWPSLIATPI